MPLLNFHSLTVLNKLSKRVLQCFGHCGFVKKELHDACNKGGVVLMLNGEHYTSKTCLQCGEIHERLGSNRVFECPKCKYVAMRDGGGSINIIKRTVCATSVWKCHAKKK